MVAAAPVGEAVVERAARGAPSKEAVPTARREASVEID